MIFDKSPARHPGSGFGVRRITAPLMLALAVAAVCGIARDADVRQALAAQITIR